VDLPVPVTKDAKGWHYDWSPAPTRSVRAAIGRNEIDVIEALRTYHDAQNDYAEQIATATASSNTRASWSAPMAPRRPVLGRRRQRRDQSARPAVRRTRGAELARLSLPHPRSAGTVRTGRRVQATRSANNMSRGFALIAWPGEIRRHRRDAFMISHDGGVFERDLGKDTEAAPRRR
jgi:hypothetical protein